jgi:hypothetical protein
LVTVCPARVLVGMRALGMTLTCGPGAEDTDAGDAATAASGVERETA